MWNISSVGCMNVEDHLSSWRSLRRSLTLSDSTDCFSLVCSHSRKLSCCFCRLENKRQVVLVTITPFHCSLWDFRSKKARFYTLLLFFFNSVLPVTAIAEGEMYLKSFADVLLEPKKSHLFKSLRSDSICFCLLRQWVLNVPTSSCCSFSQSVNSESCWGGNCWLPLSSWSFSWSRRLSASLDFKKAWCTWKKLWGPVHHPTIHSAHLPVNLIIHLQWVFAEMFPHLFRSQGSQSTHWRTAASPGTIPQTTASHLEKNEKILLSYTVWFINRTSKR